MLYKKKTKKKNLNESCKIDFDFLKRKLHERIERRTRNYYRNFDIEFVCKKDVSFCARSHPFSLDGIWLVFRWFVVYKSARFKVVLLFVEFILFHLRVAFNVYLLYNISFRVCTSLCYSRRCSSMTLQRIVFSSLLDIFTMSKRSYFAVGVIKITEKNRECFSRRCRWTFWIPRPKNYPNGFDEKRHNIVNCFPPFNLSSFPNFYYENGKLKTKKLK